MIVTVFNSRSQLRLCLERNWRNATICPESIDGTLPANARVKKDSSYLGYHMHSEILMTFDFYLKCMHTTQFHPKGSVWDRFELRFCSVDKLDVSWCWSLGRRVFVYLLLSWLLLPQPTSIKGLQTLKLQHTDNIRFPRRRGRREGTS